MPVTSFEPSPLDRPSIVQMIRDVFRRSPLFSEAHISDPLPGPDGAVSLEVRFSSSPALFHIMAPSSERAYAMLYELAVSLVGVERAYVGVSRREGEGDCNDTGDGTPSPGARAA